MTLKDGTYRICFVPVLIQPPFSGGLYATATGIGEPVLAEPRDGDDNHQVWEVRRNAETGRYTITQPGFEHKNPLLAPGPVLMGWSLANPSESFPGGNILFRPNCSEFDIELVGEEGRLMYSVRVPNPKGVHSLGLDCEFYVTERDHTLLSQAFWSTRRFIRPHPHWLFVPAERK